jgi:hypothetical protein
MGAGPVATKAPLSGGRRRLPPEGIGIQDLRAFGRAAGLYAQHVVLEGGFVAPGRQASPSTVRGEERCNDVRESSGSEETGSAAGPWEGRRASAPTTPSTPSYPVERGLSTALRLEELFQYHPDARWLGSSSSTAFISAPVGLFSTLPYRAILVIEVPAEWPSWLMGYPISDVPAVRAWAFWSDGIVVRSHHQYPDESICACQPGQWRLGRDGIEDYVGFCVCWIAKALHLQVLGWWPGPQHYPAAVRVARNRPDEFCGCGSDKRYADCHATRDLQQSPYSRWLEVVEAQRGYRLELQRRGLSEQPLRGLQSEEPRKRNFWDRTRSMPS